MLLRMTVAGLSTIALLGLAPQPSGAMGTAAVPAVATSGVVLVQGPGPGGQPGGPPPRGRPPGSRPPPGGRPPVAGRPPPGGWRPPPGGRPPGGPWAGGWHPPPRPRGWVGPPPPRGGWGWGRPAGYWWGPGGAIAAGAAIGFLTATAAGAFAPAPPAPRLCWYYTDPSRTAGFWDSCP